MIGRSLLGFAIGASAVAGLGALALVPWLQGAPPGHVRWAVAGLAAMALPGIAGGVWLVGEHGRPGTGFVVALGAGIGARLLLASIAAVGASYAGDGAGRALVVGLGAGFAPVALFEMIWFARRTSLSAGAKEPGR